MDIHVASETVRLCMQNRLFLLSFSRWKLNFLHNPGLGCLSKSSSTSGVCFFICSSRTVSTTWGRLNKGSCPLFSGDSSQECQTNFWLANELKIAESCKKSMNMCKTCQTCFSPLHAFDSLLCFLESEHRWCGGHWKTCKAKNHT